MISFENNITAQRIEQGGLDVDTTLDLLRWDGDSSNADVATEGEQAGLILSLFIPLVLAIWTFSSAIQPSIDMTAGEREEYLKLYLVYHALEMNYLLANGLELQLSLVLASFCK